MVSLNICHRNTPSQLLRPGPSEEIFRPPHPCLLPSIAKMRIAVSGDSLFARIELIGYKDPTSGQIKIPRRPLDPGAKVMTVDYQFLKTTPTRPCFIVYEEGHSFAPAGEAAISHRIIKKIAGEGRKFGVGFAIVSQRPSKLDPDVTSQCNTLITMRLKNPDDQRFIAKASDMVSQADIDELPSLSTGEALVCGRSIPAPLLVKVGTKALLHGGQSPEVIHLWGKWNGEGV
jgi:DNA helicase HerA-like ATPase